MANHADAAYYSSTGTATREASREDDKNVHRFVHLDSKYTMDVYEGLGINKEFKTGGFDISKIDWEKQCYKGAETEARSIQHMITNFEKRIYTKCIDLDNLPGLEELVFDENGDMNYQIRGYLESIHDGSYHLQAYQTDKGCPNFKVYSFSQPMCNKVCQHLKQAFVKESISDQVMKQKQVANFIKEWAGKRKLKVVSSNDEATSSVVMYLTYDLHCEFVNLLSGQYEDEVHISLPCHYLVFLEKFGHNVLHCEADKAHVQASIDGNSKTLTLRGYAKDIELFKTSVREMFHKAYLTISHYTHLNKLSRGFDKKAEANKCTWSVCPLDQPKEFEGFEFLTTIYHPATPGSLSCIIGDVSSLKVDGLILLVTDRLFPLHILKGSMINVQQQFQRLQADKQLALGEFVHGKTLYASFGCVFQLVSVFSNIRDEPEQHPHILHHGFKNILSELDHHKVKSICLPVSEMYHHYTTEGVVQSFIEALIETDFEQMNVNFYVCFEEDFPDTRKIHDDITERFRKAKKGFLRRQFLKTDAQVNETMKIKHDFRRLQDVNAETIVNTSRVDLDLSKGVVSSSLLEAAGQELQNYCSEHYQNGITLKEVAVTPCFNLEKRTKNSKHILHGALPQFHVLNFQQDIKNFMKLCLSKAEELGCQSIAFPSLGTGRHGNPVRETIKVMFDAVEEYQEERLNQRLKEVVFSFPSDDCKQAFENEENRRKEGEKVKFYCFENLDCEYLEGKIVNSYCNCSIMFGKKHWFEDVPSYTVDVDFEPGKSSYFKYGYERPFSGSDQQIIELEVTNSDTEAVKTAVTTCLQYCQTHRMTEISLNAIKASSLTTTEYYQAVTDALLAFIKGKKETVYILKIYIKVDEEDLQTLKSHFLCSKGLIGHISSKLSRADIKWQKSEGKIGRTPMQIQVLGTTNDSVHKVKEGFLEYMRNQTEAATHSGKRTQGTSQEFADLGARPKDKAANRQMKRKNEGQNDDGDRQMDKSQHYEGGFHNDIFHRKVSAEINPGFFNFKDRVSGLNHWIQKVEEEFQVKITKEKDRYIVRGNYIDVSALKYYLDSSFPEDPSKILVENILTHIQNDPIHHKRRAQESVEVFVEVDEDLAEAVCRLYTCDEVEGVSNWQYSAEQKGLWVTCQSDISCDVEHIKKDVKRKADNMVTNSYTFEDANESMIAESVCYDLQQTKERQAYIKFVSHESKVIIIAKNKQLADTAKDELLRKVKKSVSDTEPMQDGGEKFSLEIPVARSNSYHMGTGIKVKIYEGDIVSLPVKAIVVPALKSANNITSIQRHVLSAAGEDVKHEYKKLFSGSATMVGGDCKITSAGNLHFEKLYHIYLPQFKSDRENIEQFNMFEKVLVNTFIYADKDGTCSIGLPFIGSGNTGYGLDICVQQYFKAVTSLEWENTNLTEIHFVGTNKEQVDKIRSMFEKLLTNYSGKRAIDFDKSDQPSFPAVENHFSSDVIPLGKSDKVKLYIAEGSVSAIKADVVACPVDERFCLNDGVAREMLQLCGQTMETELLKQRQKALPSSKPGIFEVSVKESDATFDSVVFAVLPRVTETQREDFENIVKERSFSFLQKARERRFKRVALPLLVKEERDDYSVVKLCCSAMMERIFDFVYQYEEAVKEIHILDKDPHVLVQFRESAIQLKQNFSFGLSKDSSHL